MKRRSAPWRTMASWTGILAAATAAVAAIVVLFGPVSDLIAQHDVGGIRGQRRAVALQSARDAARGRLLTLGAGLFAAGALVYTARNFTLARRTFELTEQGQVTDRYTKSIEQLGSDKLDVRIGGIYALERVAHDSPRDQPTVIEVLAAFIREHSPEPWSPSGDEPSMVSDTGRPRADVQAAITVIGRRNSGYDQQRINLASTNLKIMNLTGADLAGADLWGVNLTGANLTGANLAAAGLRAANLTRADLTAADLTNVDAGAARLQPPSTGTPDWWPEAHETDFIYKTKFNRANLTHAVLSGADLTGADFTRAVLTSADLRGANLTDARWSPSQTVPEGWQYGEGHRLRRADADSGGQEGQSE